MNIKQLAEEISVMTIEEAKSLRRELERLGSKAMVHWPVYIKPKWTSCGPCLNRCSGHSHCREENRDRDGVCSGFSQDPESEE